MAKKYDYNEVTSCENCSYNEGFSEWPGHRLPCGQFKCWHELHEERRNEFEEDE